ncbi:MAG: choice-of-anchor J domain-containing protein [Candidatus Cloacimonetes bacterium]|nr:choice-of-anchor J domain-containing protein [Candidatus Cloacimonadota bacterium]
MKKILFVILALSLLCCLFATETSATVATRAQATNADGVIQRSTPKAQENTVNPVTNQLRNSILEEGFEGTAFPPAGWTIQSTLTGQQLQLSQWIRISDSEWGGSMTVPHSGTAAAVSRSWYTNPINPNNYLITPLLQLPAGESIAVTYWMQPEYGGPWGAEQYTLYVSTSGNQMSDFTTVLHNETFPLVWNPEEYVSRTISLSAYAGQSVYLAWRHHDCADNSALFIDDIIVEVTQPRGTLTGTVTSSGAPLSGATVTVVGAGNSTTTNAQGQYSIINIPVGTYSVTAERVGYTTGTNTGVVITDGQTTTSNFVLEYEGIEQPIITTYPFYEGFESITFPPVGWITENLGTGPNWARVDAGYQEAGSARSISWADQVAFNADNWLITPRFAIPTPGANEAIIVSWHAMSVDPAYPDFYQLLVSTSGNHTNDFSVVFSEIATPGNWGGVEYDLSEYAGQTIQLAFRHLQADMFQIVIDGIRVGMVPTNIPPYPPRNLTVTNDNSFITLNWSEPEGPRTPVKYTVYRNGEVHSELDGTTLTFVDTNLINGLAYEYFVTASYVLPIGTSDPSNPVTGEPEGTVIFPFVPTNLELTHFDQNVTITWDDPEYKIGIPPPAEPFFFNWSNSYSGIGFSGGNPFTIGKAARFSPDHLAERNVAGWQLVGVEFFAGNNNSVGSRFTIRVFIGGTSISNHGTEVLVQEWGVSDISTVGTVVATGFANWIDIPMNQELRIRIDADAPGNSHPVCFGADEADGVFDWGNLLWSSSGYTPVHEIPALADVRGNAMIAGWAMDPAGNLVRFGGGEAAVSAKEFEQNILVRRPVEHNFSATEIITVENNPREIPKTRNLIQYNVYRGGTFLTNINVNEPKFFVDKLAPAGNQTYSVTATYQGWETESSPVEATVQVVERVYLSVFPYLEDFESQANFNVFLNTKGWFVYDADDDGRNWAFWTQVPYMGARCLGSSSRVGPNEYTPDNWIISPRIVAPAEGGFSLHYMVAAHDQVRFAENYSVYLLRNGPDVNNEPVLLLSETLDRSAWQNRWINLQEYLGETFQIAFRHHDVTGQLTLKIDMFHLQPNPNELEPGITPIRTELLGNYPNPFNPETIINFTLSKEAPVVIDIYNIRGQKVRELTNDIYTSGSHQVIWNGTDDNGRAVSSGVYFYQLNADNVSSTRRMVLMK